MKWLWDLDASTQRGASKHVGSAESTLNKLRVYGGGPRYIKIGRRVAQVRFSDTLLREVPGDGTRYSLRFQASPLLKAAIQPGGPALRRKRQRKVLPVPAMPPPPAPRPPAPLAEIRMR
ncbi:hypothetical protein LJE71_16190 [Xanthobacter autotrophicus]|uniref:hypothetical protein n=1 Tax=Xanthobacter autotrophicus TaxID=280 RepID=UPI001E304114|nr:hypothetical protein [Xanthobacter autotrophicus]UDQ87828.1 hypothetical protein LJE71_16190 [Xanthobacter autotrophicus]